MEKSILKNNSNEMKTVVETFVVEETAELIYDGEKLEQWNNLVTELGLIGQSQIVKPDKSPVPFMHLKQELKIMFEVLCPMKVDVNKYDISPIPVEILDLVALSKREGYFDKIQIWYDDKGKDPACIGLRYRDEQQRAQGYSWNMEHYLLGKWADVKHSFKELQERARKRFIQTKKIELNQTIKMCQRELEDLDSITFNQLGADLPF